MKKLIAVEIKLEEEETHTYPKGYAYTVLQDPETEKCYRPSDGWTVTGDDLSKLFVEIKED